MICHHTLLPPISTPHNVIPMKSKKKFGFGRFIPLSRVVTKNLFNPFDLRHLFFFHFFRPQKKIDRSLTFKNMSTAIDLSKNFFPLFFMILFSILQYPETQNPETPLMQKTPPVLTLKLCLLCYSDFLN